MVRRRTKLVGAASLVAAVVIAVLAMTLTSSARLSTNHATVPTFKVHVQRPSLAAAVASSLRRSLKAPAVGVPLAVVIPSIGVNSRLLAVGMTPADAMAAPEGGANSPYWSDTFWYRGSAVPGAVGTATIAGHIDDRYGDYAVFGRLSQLVPGERIFIKDTKTGFQEQFVVTSSRTYTLAQSKTLPVLDAMYGTGPPLGEPAQPSRDGLAHLSLITCAGQWQSTLGTHDERLVVSAVRVR